MNENKERQAAQRAADKIGSSRNPDTWSQLANQVRAQWGAAADTVGDAMCEAGRTIQRTGHVTADQAASALKDSARTNARRAQAVSDTTGMLSDTINKTGKLAQDQLAVATAALAGVAGGLASTRKKQSKSMTRSMKRSQKQATKGWRQANDAMNDLWKTAVKGLNDLSDTMADTSKQAAKQWQKVSRSLDDMMDRRRKVTPGIQMQRQARKTLAQTGKLLVLARISANAGKTAFGTKSRQQKRQTGSGFSPSWLWAAGLGAGLMYFLDPDRGRGRRAMARDQFTHVQHVADDTLFGLQQNVANRARGLTAQTQQGMSSEPVTDYVLVERVRSHLGRVVSNPGSVEVIAQNGHVTLSGPVLAREEKRLLARVRAVPGVTGIDNRLQVHDQPGNVPGLQGVYQNEMDGNEQHAGWAPRARLVAGMAGGLLTVTGITAGGFMGAARSAMGLGLLALGIAVPSSRRGTEQAGALNTVDVHKTITVNAPVHEVFNFWRRFDNFPSFMSHVNEVRDLGENRTHWVVDGPAGTHVSWDAVTTRMVSNSQIAWESEPGSTVRNSGRVRFTALPEGRTQVDVDMSYAPPAGVLGHAVASFFGSNPKQQMDDDLARFKMLVESGTAPAGGSVETRNSAM